MSRKTFYMTIELALSAVALLFVWSIWPNSAAVFPAFVAGYAFALAYVISCSNDPRICEWKSSR